MAQWHGQHIDGNILSALTHFFAHNGGIKVYCFRHPVRNDRMKVWRIIYALHNLAIRFYFSYLRLFNRLSFATISVFMCYSVCSLLPSIVRIFGLLTRALYIHVFIAFICLSVHLPTHLKFALRLVRPSDHWESWTSALL